MDHEQPDKSILVHKHLLHKLLCKDKVPSDTKTKFDKLCITIQSNYILISTVT